MTQNKDSKTNYHEEENAMVTDLDDLKDLGKEMNQFSAEFLLSCQFFQKRILAFLVGKGPFQPEK